MEEQLAIDEAYICVIRIRFGSSIDATQYIELQLMMIFSMPKTWFACA